MKPDRRQGRFDRANGTHVNLKRITVAILYTHGLTHFHSHMIFFALIQQIDKRRKGLKSWRSWPKPASAAQTEELAEEEIGTMDASLRCQ